MCTISARIARSCIRDRWHEIKVQTDNALQDNDAVVDDVDEDQDSTDSDEEENERLRKTRKEWTAKEDWEIVKLVRRVGEGNWKVIFDNSIVLQNRYKFAQSGTLGLEKVARFFRRKMTLMVFSFTSLL